MTRRSHNGIIMFIQKAPIIWFSTIQNMVGADTFGSKLVALSIFKGLVVALRYKLRMFCVRLKGPAYVFCDNRGFVKNMSIPESVIHKKKM